MYRLRGSECYHTVLEALRLGYRHIDTASIYKNHSEVGQAIRDAVEQEIVANQRDIFVTTKIGPNDQGEEHAYKAVQKSLTELGLDQIDLVLIHWPGISGQAPGSHLHKPARQGTWKALTRHQKEGTVCHIGVSNYTVSHMQEFDFEPIVKPAVLQIEIHPWYIPDPDLLAWCTKHCVIVQAYASLGAGQLLDTCKDMPQADIPALRLNVKRAQVLLAWALSHGWVIIPMTRSPQRLLDNLNSHYLQLLPSEISALDNLACCKQQKLCWDPSQLL